MIFSLVFCFLSAISMLLLPEDLSSRMYLHEFLTYRYSFMHSILYETSESMDLFIASLKFIPHLAGAVLIIVGLFREKELLS